MNTVLAERMLQPGQSFQIVHGDITLEAVDAIVNAANRHLQHGGGVARAILQGGGEIIQQESDEWIRTHGPVTHSRPAWTSAGRLPAKYVIHAAGPVWGEGDEDTKLAEVITGIFRLADELKLQSIAMPAISTGIFGFPRDRAAGILFHTTDKYFSKGRSSGIRLVRVVLFDRPSADVFLKIWNAGPGK